ncbi:MAG: zinc dependent phospholipase C family protein [Eubacteriales bacterium]
MALPMVHLNVAKNISDSNNIIINNIPDFYLGAIAPDAVHMTEVQSGEAKSISHLNARAKDTTENLRAITDFIDCNKLSDSFYLGYIVHVLTDVFWVDNIYNLYISRYKNDIEPVQDKYWAYYNDTDQLDFVLYKETFRQNEIWQELYKSQPAGIDNIIGKSEVEKWKHHTLKWYESGKSRHQNPIRYITIEELHEFITSAAKKCILFLDDYNKNTC